jgi:benzoylformate decarboxylase
MFVIWVISPNQKKVRDTLSDYDLLICLGGDLLRMSAFSDVDPLPQGMPVVHISERDWELGKNYFTELAIRATVKSTIEQLLPRLSSAMSDQQRQEAAQRLKAFASSNWSARRNMAAAELKRLVDRPERSTGEQLARVLDRSQSDDLSVG